MDEKILELLQKMDTRLNKIESDINDLKTGQVNMEHNIKDLKVGQVEMQKDITEIKTDVKINRNTLDAVIKHTSTLVGDTADIKDDLNNIEIVTSKNWNDIAKLKAIK